MTPDDAIFILEYIKADCVGVKADAIKLGIQALKDIKHICNMETGNYVKPVRCKDCVHWKKDDNDSLFAICGFHGSQMFVTDYCSYGKMFSRKNELVGKTEQLVNTSEQLV